MTEDDRKKIIDNFMIQLSKNVNTSLNRKFPTKEDKFRDFTSMNIQHQLSRSPYINSIIDYGRFRFSLDNINYDSDLKSVLSITEDYNQSYIGTYSILEKCEGGDLKTRYDNNKDIFKKINVLRKLFENILLGIDVIHANGYLHRDLKPENIGLKYSLDKNYGPSIGDFEKNTEIEILDFGLATKVDKYTYPAGTREFFSPDIQSKFIQTKRAIDNQNLENTKEDRVKKFVSKKDDIFAVGIMLFDLIHGYSSIQGEIIDNNYLIDFNYEVIEGNIILSGLEDYYELLFVIFDKENKKIFIEKSEIEDEEFIFKKLPKFLGDNTNIDNLKYVLYSPEKVRSTPIQYDLFGENTPILNDSLISFLDGMLSIEEDDRFDVNTALSHEWIKTKRLSDKEVNPKKVAKVTIELDNLN